MGLKFKIWAAKWDLKTRRGVSFTFVTHYAAICKFSVNSIFEFVVDESLMRYTEIQELAKA